MNAIVDGDFERKMFKWGRVMKITVDPHKPGEIKVRGGEKRHKASYNEIAAMAYQLYEEEGRPHGRDQEHWFRAEEIVDRRGKDGRH